MKRTILLFLFLSIFVGLVGCMPIVDEIVETPNQPPVINFWAYHSPNGVEQHQPYEWDIAGNGYDPDGEIVQWVIRINGETFRVGNAPDKAQRSEIIRYQFPQVGWYLLSVTAFDDDGASTTYTPPPGGLWHIQN